MSAVLNRPKQFVRDLNMVSGLLRAPTSKHAAISHRNSNRGSCEGKVAHKSATPVQQRDFTELAGLFRDIRASAIERLGGADWQKDLPADDPLRCRVGLFGTLDYGLRETAHTRALAWLLDPKSSHGFESSLLQALLKEIFDLADNPMLTEVRVHSELSGSESQDRLDLFLEGRWSLTNQQDEAWMVIVEAKIEAEEGLDQCARYESEYRERLDSTSRHKLI